jgi:hypothetical protein
MHPPAKAFKAVASQVCRRRGFPLSKLMQEGGLEDVLIDATANQLSATAIAGSVLWNCCCTEGKWNNSAVAMLVVMQYLNDHVKNPGSQAYADLASILKAGTNQEGIAKWLESHFA